MSEPAIQVEDLWFAYGEHEAVRGLSFQVAPGEILGFLGPNGAGKSTTIKILTAQLPPRSGRARVLGVDVTRQDPRIAARIGVCFEEKNLYRNLSARENLRFFARLFGLKKPDIDGLLRSVDLADRGDDRVSAYSKGMRQRLMMARALLNRPEVLFLDEPTAGLDPASSETVRGLIRRAAEGGAAVLLTTHDMHVADLLSHRVAFLDEGTLHALDTPENLKQEHGRRAVQVRRRVDDRVVVESFPLDDEAAGTALKEALSSGEVLTIHTEEATLESIFIEMTGRGLRG